MQKLISLTHTQTDMDILKLLSCKGNRSSVVGQEVVSNFEETRWHGTLPGLFDDLAG